MASQSPKVDQRTASDVSDQVRELMKLYLAGFSGASTGPSAALIGIFSRYAEIVIQRLNQAPDRNFLAFLDLLGAALLPPRPARVPLTFSLAAGSASDGLVPAGTQVAAPPGPGEKEPVVFETERELVVTAAQLTSLYARDPSLDQYAKMGDLIAAGQQPNPFLVTTPVEHSLYLGDDDLLGAPNLTSLTVQVATERRAAVPLSVTWERGDGNTWVKMTPTSDTTAGFTANQGEVKFEALPPILPTPINGLSSRWLRCRLTTPITPAISPAQGLPRLRALTLAAALKANALPLAAAFTNALPIDAGQDFFPLGEKPRFGDTFYLACRPAFGEPTATVTLRFEIANPAGGNASVTPPPTYAAGAPKLNWEFWDGSGWRLLGVSELLPKVGADGKPVAGTPQSTPAAGVTFTDGTNAFTTGGAVTLTFPAPPQPTTVNGVENAWLRVRLVGGHYGKEAGYRLKTPNKPDDGYLLEEATLAPPIVHAVRVDYSATRPAVRPDYILTYNDFHYQAVPLQLGPNAQPFQPFQAVADRYPSLYLGFTLPPGRRAFPNRPLSLYVRVADVAYDSAPAPQALSAPPQLGWQYFNGQDWLPLTVQDDTRNLSQPGLIQFLVPGDSALSDEFGERRYWLRVRWERGQYLFAPRLQRLTLNTVLAAQTLTIRDEVLGASDGSRGQRFRTTRAPVVQGQRLLLREAGPPAVAEQARLTAEEGDDAVALVKDSQGRVTDVWVRWHAVPDFYASGPRDRHYVFDHLTGMVQFGDGVAGLIPPLGAVVQMARYQTGGGIAGNRPAGTIVQLKTTVPYVDKVTNPEPASGGADAEPLSSLVERAPRTIRHRDRAVTIEDYADLARLASPAVARTQAVPLYDLRTNPLAGPAAMRSGVVSVMIVPRGDDAKPSPTLELIQQVQDYLQARSLPTVEVVVVSPLYVRIHVTAEIAVASLDGASRVQADVVAALTRFLHPLSGGLDGAGWDFGRAPYRSDLYALIEAIPGVDHIRKLVVQSEPELPGAEATDRFLVYSGVHTVTLTAERF